MMYDAWLTDSETLSHLHWENDLAHCNPIEGRSRACGNGAESPGGGIGCVASDHPADGSKQRYCPRRYREPDESHGRTGDRRRRVHQRRCGQPWKWQGSALAQAHRVTRAASAPLRGIPSGSVLWHRSGTRTVRVANVIEHSSSLIASPPPRPPRPAQDREQSPVLRIEGSQQFIGAPR
jgi:hypothetical protein